MNQAQNRPANYNQNLGDISLLHTQVSSQALSGGGGLPGSPGLGVEPDGLCHCPRLVPGRLQAPSPAPARTACSRRLWALQPPGCWEWERSLSHEQDSRVTRQGCQAKLSRLRTRLGLLGGARSWGVAPSLLEEDGGWAPGGGHRHLHSPISKAWSSHYEEPPENDRSPAASLFTPLLRPVTPWVTGGCLAARSNQAGPEVRAGGGFPLWTLSLGQHAGWVGSRVPGTP